MKPLPHWCTSVFVSLPLLISERGLAAEAGRSSPVTPADTVREVVVLRSDDHSLVFEYRPRFSAPAEIRQDAQVYSLYDFPMSRTSDEHHEAGSPDMRFRNFPVALPGPIGNAVRIIAADYEDIPSVTMAPVPAMKMQDGMLTIAAYAMNSTAYGMTGFMPASIVQLSTASPSRSLIIAGLHVYPLQFNPALRTVRRYSRIVIEVSYGTRTTRPVSNQDEKPFRNLLLNYNMASSWKVASAPAVIRSSVLHTGQWYRLTVSEDGMYRLSSEYLKGAGIDLASVDPRTVRIFGNGGTEVPEDLSAARPEDLVENSIYVEGESDGKFDAADFVLFYGRSTRNWRYDPAAKKPRHYINHYTDVNYYWLTFGGTGGKRMATQASLNSSTAFAPETFIDGVAVEKESQNILLSGKDWLGQRIEPNSSYTLLNPLPGLFQNGVIRYTLALAAGSASAPTFSVRESGGGNVLLGSYILPAASSETIAATGRTCEATGPSQLTNNTSVLNIAYQTSSAGSSSWIDWVEIVYPRILWGIGNALHFRAPDTSTVVEYRLQQFTEVPWIFNVTSCVDVRRVTGVIGSFMFQASEAARQPSEFWAAAPSAWKVPAAIEPMANEDLRGFSEGAEFIIVTSPELRSPAERLKAFRQSQGISTIVVDVNQIYNEFAGGLPDVSGIRDYLRYAYTNWDHRPRYVLMFGQASYDYKGLLGSKSSYVPTWQSAESRDDLDSYCTDDFFAKFGPGNALSLVMGRISSRNVAEAEAVVDKLIRYDTGSAHDSWKLRIAYLGDDSWTPKWEDGTIHSRAMETLAELHTPNVFEKQKIYIAEYPTEFQAQGRRKPGAYEEIIDRINRGVLLFNYAGHGNPIQLADEKVFDVYSSIPRLVNGDRLTVFLLATCSFSQFDDRERESGGELLMNKPDGGAIAVLSAARKVDAGSNDRLTQGTYDCLFDEDVFGRIIPLRPAEALFLYKAGGNDGNDQRFFFMGDPTMRLQFPARYVSIDSINQQSADSVGGKPRMTPVPIRALSRVTVSGSVRGEDNGVDNSIDGRITLLVNDPTHKKVIADFYNRIPWGYSAAGGTIYRGENSISNGRFQASFIVPRDVSFADSAAHGRMLAFFSSTATDGAGITEQFSICPPESMQVSDRQGPAIRVYLDNRSFRSGDMVSDKPLLIVDLKDSNGINTSSSGIGHRIEAWVNSSTQSQDITDAYTSALDNFREGTVQYPLSGLPQGRNTLRVRAWDSFDNSATVETFFDVSSGDNLTLSDVMNYPNPFASSTSFTFRQNQTGLLNVKVKIYTVAGRLIQTLATTSAGESFVRVPWDGRDRDGDILANGVYLYKVIVSTADGRFTSEALGKLAIAK